jgi:threonine/homoserine/homoserine lactone efflux protein
MSELYSILLPMILFASAATFTPGPNNVMLTAAGANFGFRRALPHIGGVLTGSTVILLGMLGGLGALFERYPEMQTALKYLGSMYLLFFAWKVANMGRSDQGGTSGRPFTFLESVSFQFINPKVWLMGLSAVGAFTLGGDLYVPSAAALCMAFAITTLLATSIWAGFGVAIGRLLQTERSFRIFNGIMGLLTAGSVALLFL